MVGERYTIGFMRDKNTLERLNRLLEFLALHQPPKDSVQASRTFAAREGSAITLVGENMRLFDAGVDEWLDSARGGKGTLSQKTFVNELIPLIRAKKISGETFTQTEADQFEKTISAFPLQRFRVLRRIYGVMLPGNCLPIPMGDFLVYPGLWVQDQIQGSALFALTWGPQDAEGTFIECSVEARDSDKAVELADALFYRFELVMRVLIGRRTQSFEVGILNYVGPQMRNSIVLSDSGVSHGSAWQGAMQPVPVNDPFFSNPPAPFARLFQLISQENNELERHVVRCAEWTGQAMADPNAASAFVKAAIALEVMFSTNEKGMITPSIMAQIAESCAFLLGGPANSPLKVESEVKRLYGIRSAVVHSGKDSVEEGDLNSLLDICRTIIAIFLSNEELTKTQNMRSLSDYFKRRKFASLCPEGAA
jgi:hypothetical protein